MTLQAMKPSTANLLDGFVPSQHVSDVRKMILATNLMNNVALSLFRTMTESFAHFYQRWDLTAQTPSPMGDLMAKRKFSAPPI